MNNTVIVGGGGHAKVIISIIKRLEGFRLLGYVDKENRGKVLGVDYLGNDDILASVKSDQPEASAVIGVGSIDVSPKRENVQQSIANLGFTFPPVISPSAVINEGVEIGEGTVVMDGAVINAGTKIGKFCIINTSSSIDHDGHIGDFAHICPGVTLCGGVTIGRNSLIGAGSVVVQYKTIGENCLIAAGSTVVEDCLTAGFYLGTPACRRT